MEKKSYNKPELTKVKLVIEEVAQSGCKTSAAGPGKAINCNATGPRCVTSAQGS